MMETTFPPLYWSSSTDEPPPDLTCFVIRAPFMHDTWNKARAWDARCHNLEEPSIIASLSSTGCTLTFEARADAGAITGPLAGSLESLFRQHGAPVDRQGGGFQSELVDLTEDKAIGLAWFIVRGIRNDRSGWPPW